MNKELIGVMSGVLVVVSVIPYVVRTIDGKNKPVITSWGLWTVLGLALLLSYRSSGAGANVWPAVFGFSNPLLVTIIAVYKNGKRSKMNLLEWACLVFGIISIAMWVVMHNSKSLVQYALYVAIVADACASIPTIFFVWKCPAEERPFAWGFFSFAYGLAVFAITEHSFSNYILPLYMMIGSLFITLPLVLYRIRMKIPLKEWI